MTSPSLLLFDNGSGTCSASGLAPPTSWHTDKHGGERRHTAESCLQSVSERRHLTQQSQHEVTSHLRMFTTK
ncbi:hypothetical protein JOB18_016953 [Solea senegalensis]|uniref:Uncharacterized protein n=1 Tax=Solea senegalensis TaxID=28829 RepID=A0AAV6PEN4_SOLSE|nr:hypothetical protein JOB18_016953 [Solea senegalensis]